MTQDEIIEMARKVGLVIDGNQSGFDDLAAFAKLVAAKAFQNGYEKGIAAFTEAVNLEREACAKVCDELPAPDFYTDACAGMWDITTLRCGDAIRARGEA
jgi:hypothetical protein